MFSYITLGLALVSALSMTTSSAAPLESRQGGIPPSKAKVFDSSKNECDIRAALAIQIPRGKNQKGGAAESGECGPTASVFAEGSSLNDAVDVTNVGFCDNCKQNEVELSKQVFTKLGLDPSKKNTVTVVF